MGRRARGVEAGFALKSWSVLALLVFAAAAGLHIMRLVGTPSWNAKTVVLIGIVPIVAAGFIAAIVHVTSGKSQLIANAVFSGLLVVAAIVHAATLGTPVETAPEPDPVVAEDDEAPAPVIKRPAPKPAAAAEEKRTEPARPKAPAVASRPPVSSGPPEDPAIKSALIDLNAEIDQTVGSLSLKMEGLMDQLAKPPRHDRAVIDQRLADLDSAQQTAKSLATRLRGIGLEAQNMLVSKGVKKDEAVRQGSRYASDCDSSTRAGACEAYSRLCDAARRESEYLRDNFSKWSLDGQGLVSSKESWIQSQAKSSRSWVESQMKDRDGMAERLRGKPRY
jgi:hypothetical protein